MEQTSTVAVCGSADDAVAALQLEVQRLREALWACYETAGGDPHDYLGDDMSNEQLVALVLDCVQDLRGLFDAARRDLR